MQILNITILIMFCIFSPVVSQASVDQIEAKVNKLFEPWNKHNIFVPLGMERTTFKDDIGKIIPGSAQSYIRSDDGCFLHALDNEAAPGPGSLFVSAEDLAGWMATFQTDKVGTAEIWSRMFEKGKLSDGQDLPYAAGLIVGSYKRLPVSDFERDSNSFNKQSVAKLTISRHFHII